jgi:nitric oxide dioxygenase
MTRSNHADAPTMTPRQIALVRDSFALVVPIRQTAASLFYARLFEIAPEVRPLFPRDVAAQGAKLMAALAVLVHELDRLDGILPDIEALAVRHVGYGAREDHYAAVGEALIWTLEQGLGTGFTEEAREAWIAAYATLSGAMIAAACGADQAA